MSLHVGYRGPGHLSRVGGQRYSPEALAAFAAMSVQPSRALKGLYNTAIVALKASGIWAKDDARYFIDVHDAQAARLNLKNPGTYNLSATNGPVFTAYVGYAGDGAAAFLNTGFNPSTAGGNFVQDSARVTAWSLKSGTDAGQIAGYVATSPNIQIYPRFTDGSAYGTVNSNSGAAVTSADGVGLWQINRTAANAQQLLKNGASVGTSANASVAPSNVNIGFLRGAANFFSGSIAFGSIGSSLTAQQLADEYTILSAFKAGVAAL